jgi:AAA domain
VTPYNAQVRTLRQAAPDGVRVGTVDKFQGQEAPVVIISLASSSGDDAPRGLSFVFNKEPDQRRDLSCAVPRRARLLPAPARSRLQDRRRDAAGQCALPPPRARCDTCSRLTTPTSGRSTCRGRMRRGTRRSPTSRRPSTATRPWAIGSPGSRSADSRSGVRTVRCRVSCDTCACLFMEQRRVRWAEGPWPGQTDEELAYARALIDRIREVVQKRTAAA